MKTSSITKVALLWHCLSIFNLAAAQAVSHLPVPAPAPAPAIINGTTPQIGTTPSVTSGGTGPGKDIAPIADMTTSTNARTKDSVAFQLERDAIARQQTTDQDKRTQGTVIARSNQVLDDKRVNTQGVGTVTQLEVSPSGIATLGSAAK